jgi:hypothetical protein
MHPYHHALSSVRKHGGEVKDFLPVHQWFDASKELLANFRHRALRHHAQGIFECERVFGATLTLSNGVTIPTRYIGEQHVMEDCGFIPSLQDWIGDIPAKDWMHGPPKHTAQEIVTGALT